MLEAMLLTKKEVPIPPTGATFLWDPVLQQDLYGSGATIAYIGGGTANTDYLIDGQGTFNLPTTSSGFTITLASPLDLSGGDWTVEWSTLNTVNNGNYGTDIAIDSGFPGSAKGVQARWSDTGFGNRVQFSTIFQQVTDCWNASLTKVTSLNTLQRFAMVCKNGQVSVFINGVKQMLANGTGGTYTAASFAAAPANLKDLKSIKIGWQNSTVQAMISRHGRIRITQSALYTTDYTPGPLEMV